MNAAYTNGSFPNLKALIAIVLILIFSIALKKCAAQTIVDDGVLRYLLGESQKSSYLQKDIKLADSTILEQSSIILYKDSIISNQKESFLILRSENEICTFELNSASAENKRLSKKVTFFKFTTYLVGAIGTIFSTYLIIK